LVFTPDWVNSEWAQFEALMLQTQDPIGLRKRILPLMLIDCLLPLRLKFFTHAGFKNKNDWEAQLERLISQVQIDFAAPAPIQAEGLFREAEAFWKERRPEYHYLYSLQGFWFCDLLLSQGQYQEVQKRANQTLEWVTQQNWLLDIALDKLSLGRAFLLQAQTETTDPLLCASSFNQARDYLHQAVADLREASSQDYLPLGLLARAACNRAQNEFALASADLEEAREIAERGEMKLFLADYHLEACKLQVASGKRQEAKENLAIAKEMIEKMGYGRRKPEVEALRRELEELKI